MIARISSRLGSPAVVAIALVWLGTLFPEATLAADEAAKNEAAKSVELVIDYGDGAQLRFAALPWREGMTVLDALEAVEKHPHGVTFARRGRGASTLITQIADLKNQGAGKNWLFSVNGKLALVGAGAHKLEPGDAVLWEFKVYE